MATFTEVLRGTQIVALVGGVSKRFDVQSLATYVAAYPLGAVKYRLLAVDASYDTLDAMIVANPTPTDGLWCRYAPDATNVANGRNAGDYPRFVGNGG